MPKICGTSATRGGPNLLRITSPARLAFSSANVIHRRLLRASSCRRFLPPLLAVLPAGIPSVARFPQLPLLAFFSSAALAYLNLNFATPRASSLSTLSVPVYFQYLSSTCISLPSCANVVVLSAVRRFFLSPYTRFISRTFRPFTPTFCCPFVCFLFLIRPSSESFVPPFTALVPPFFPLRTACSAVRPFRFLSPLSLSSHSLFIFIYSHPFIFLPFPLSHLSATRGSPLACTRAKVCLSLLVVSRDCNARPRNQRVQTAIALSRYSLFVTTAT